MLVYLYQFTYFYAYMRVCMCMYIISNLLMFVYTTHQNNDSYYSINIKIIQSKEIL
jgi:hypothetical protein